jgi:O-antigen/teichoic acid export membrane protein
MIISKYWIRNYLTPKIKSTLRDNIFKNTIYLIIINFAGAFLNYLIHPILTRNLTIAQYGDFQTLMSLYLILAFPFGVISIAVMKETAELRKKKQTYLLFCFQKNIIQKLFLFGVLGYLLLTPINFYLQSLFKIESLLSLFLINLVLIYGGAIVIFRAILQGNTFFISSAINLFIEQLAKFLLIFIFVYAFLWGLTGALLALTFSSMVSIIYAYWQIKKLLAHDITRCPTDYNYDLAAIWKYFSLVLTSAIAFTLIYNLDMLAVKYYLNSQEAGLYAALLIIGRIIFFLSTPINSQILPSVVENSHSSQIQIKILIKSLSYLGIIIFPVITLFVFYPEFIINLLIGEKYLEIAPILPYFAIPMILITLIQIFKTYFLALQNKLFFVMLYFGLIIELFLIFSWPKTIINIVLAVSISYGVIVFLMILYLLKLHLQPFSRSQPASKTV